MADTTQRQDGVPFDITGLGDGVIFGADEDGALNGGTQLALEVDNKANGDSITVKHWAQATRKDAFVEIASTPVAAGASKFVPLTGLTAYAMRFTAIFTNGLTVGVVRASVRVSGSP